MTKQSNLTRTLQMTLCAAAMCAMGAANAQAPAKLVESSSSQTPVQASPTQARTTDGVKDKGHSSTAPSKSSMEARMPAQASPSNARTVEGRKDVPHGVKTAPSQSQMEAQKPAQASPSTTGSTTGR